MEETTQSHLITFCGHSSKDTTQVSKLIQHLINAIKNTYACNIREQKKSFFITIEDLDLTLELKNTSGEGMPYDEKAKLCIELIDQEKVELDTKSNTNVPTQIENFEQRIYDLEYDNPMMVLRKILFIFDKTPEVGTHKISTCGPLNTHNTICINLTTGEGTHYLKSIIMFACYEIPLINAMLDLQKKVGDTKYDNLRFAPFHAPNEKTPEGIEQLRLDLSWLHLYSLFNNVNWEKGPLNNLPNIFAEITYLKKLKTRLQSLKEPVSFFHFRAKETQKAYEELHQDFQERLSALFWPKKAQLKMAKMLLVVKEFQKNDSNSPLAKLPEKLIHHILNYLAPAQDIENAFKHANRLAMKK